MTTPDQSAARPAPEWWLALRRFLDPLVLWIAEPRRARIGMLAIYVLLGHSGVQAIIQPPSSIEGEFGAFATGLWAWTLSLGGVIGAATVLQGWNYVERIGAYLALTGAVVYAIIVFALHVLTPGQRLSQWGFIAVTAVALVWHITDPEFRRYRIAPRPRRA